MSNQSPHPELLSTLLVPARIFIGAGWLRAGVEKVRKPDWFDGHGVTEFLDDHDGVGFFEDMIGAVFGGAMAPTTATVVYVLQILVGFGILVGAGSSALLLVGITMNSVFLLSGATNPSAFYILIQLLLLWSGAGATLGVDRWARPGWSPLLVAQPTAVARWMTGRLALGQALLGLAIAAACAPFIATLEPVDVKDDAAAMAVFCGLLPVILLAASQATRASVSSIMQPASDLPVDRAGSDQNSSA